MQAGPYKQCPECGSEYHLHIERCADCDVPLDLPGVGRVAPPVGTHHDWVAIGLEFPSEPTELQLQAELLNRSGIPCRILRSQESVMVASQGLALEVPRQVVEEARAVLHAFVQSRTPGLEPSDPAANASMLCPACGDPLEISDGACAGCGLALPDAAAHCPHCAQELRDDADRCASCGGEIRWT